MRKQGWPNLFLLAYFRFAKKPYIMFMDQFEAVVVETNTATAI